ncbi:MAG: DUF5671 domain-containing protein [bacterium]
MEYKNSAKFAFFYMLSLVALVFMSVSTGMIIFQIINKYIKDFVDAINQYNGGAYSSDQLKFAISALIISAPIYYFTTRQIFKNLFSGELDKNSGVRKWLTYFILLITSAVMIGWMIATINNFLDGELTLKFILKAITALGISAIIFTFYLHDIKREEVANTKDKITKLYLCGSLALIIIAFAASLFTVETPTQARNRKLDEAVINDFNSIGSAIENYYQDNEKLPGNIAELKKDSNFLTEDDAKDPKNGKEYEYKIIDDKTYELCAEFKTSNKDDAEAKNEYGGLPFGFGDFYLHDSGYQCLKNKINQEEEKEIQTPAPAETVE